jgi:uncharacterized protein (TIGR03083 family)
VNDIDHGALYRDLRDRVTALVSGLPAEALDQVAPATPMWRVRDVVAHLAGSTADVVAGNLEGVASDAWTQAQVDARLDTPFPEVLAEWTRCGELVEPTIASFPPLMRNMLLIDAVTHEHDLRGALGLPGERDGDAMLFAFGGVSRGIGAQRGDSGALRIVHEGGESVVGEGEPTATVRTTRFEVVRAGLGRRSLGQIAAWEWDGAAQPESAVLGRFSPTRTSPLVE